MRYWINNPDFVLMQYIIKNILLKKLHEYLMTGLVDYV